MSRWYFRNWFLPKKKKRGDRGIGSRLLGGVGEIILAALLCLTGIALGAMLVTVQLAVPGPNGSYYSTVEFSLRLVAIAAVIAVGILRVVSILWAANCSVERRSALVGRVRSREAKQSTQTLQFPNVPLESELQNSPGTQLRFRLVSRQAVNQNLSLSACVCFGLIGVASVTSVLAWRSIVDSQWDWLMLFVSFACLGGAAWSTYLFLKNLIRAAAIGPTTLEVSNHPMYPGQPVRLYLRQSGRLRIRRLEIHLICTESAAYHQGTNIRTESREVYRMKVHRESDVRVEPATSLERDIELELPKQIMHSFRSSSNSILWHFQVRGLSSRWAKFDRNYQVVVLPVNPQEPRRA